MKKTKVIINGITVKDTDSSDPKKIMNWECRIKNNEITTANLVAQKGIKDLVDIKNGQSIEIWTGFTTSTDKRVLYGYINDLGLKGGTYEIEAKSELHQLVKKNVNKIYNSDSDPTNGKISAIAKDLIETYGGLTANVEDSGTSEARTIEQFKCINTDVFERVKALADALYWEIYYDDNNREVHFEPQSFEDSGITLNTKQEIIAVPDWEYDTDMMVNDLRVDGATTDTTITESGTIGTDSGFETSQITLNKTPNSVELLIDGTQKEGGTEKSGNYFYLDRERKKIYPTDSTGSFPSGSTAKVNYIWSAPAPIHMSNGESIDNYGQHQKAITLQDVSSVADAETRAKSILNRRSVPFVNGEIRVRSQSGNIPDVGQLVTINDEVTPKISNKDPSGDYVVTEVKYQFPSGSEEIEVGDKLWRLAEWQTNTENRIKRLEERFVRNQDIIVELIQLGDSVKVEPRYYKLGQKNIGGTTLIWGNESFNTWNEYNWGSTKQQSFILGHSEAGILGESELGSKTSEEVLSFMQQYNDVYEEKFIDEDFKDSSTTADWSSDGTLNFTSGQVAISTSIDYNNGTITQAKLTSTENSGSFDYYLSADGGSNWESVTSGSLHEFTNTGNDLRWKAEENASSTGEIDKIKIEEYHN